MPWIWLWRWTLRRLETVLQSLPPPGQYLLFWHHQLSTVSNQGLSIPPPPGVFENVQEHFLLAFGYYKLAFNVWSPAMLNVPNSPPQPRTSPLKRPLELLKAERTRAVEILEGWGDLTLSFPHILRNPWGGWGGKEWEGTTDRVTPILREPESLTHLTLNLSGMFCQQVQDHAFHCCGYIIFLGRS